MADGRSGDSFRVMKINLEVLCLGFKIEKT